MSTRVIYALDNRAHVLEQNFDTNTGEGKKLYYAFSLLINVCISCCEDNCPQK